MGHSTDKIKKIRTEFLRDPSADLDGLRETVLSWKAL